MNLKEQTYVCTLADIGNLTQAAKQLYVSQPALSLYISNLENTLGIRLFERVGKQFVPTEAGELYIEKARQMLRLKDTFDSELSSILNGQTERLRVGMQDIRAHFLTPDILPEITEMYPKVKFQWQTGNYSPMKQQLLENQLDLVFCNCNKKEREFEYIPLVSDEVVFIAPRNHPLTKYARFQDNQSFPWIDLSLFSGERFILPAEEQSLRRYSNQILKGCSVQPKEVLTLRKIFIIIGLVNNGAEESKGTPLLREAHQKLKTTPGIRFVGNVEPRDIPSGNVDVVVCDGFTGNVVLKLTEGMAKMIMGMVKGAFYSSTTGKLAGLMMKGKVAELKKQMDSEEYGGAPFLGARQPVIKAHGSSKAKAIKNAIRQAKKCVDNDLCGTMQAALDDVAAANAAAAHANQTENCPERRA